jgi:glyoxylase-like metal-dependent hydrolase (beta-lactamase superfamily II)
MSRAPGRKRLACGADARSEHGICFAVDLNACVAPDTLLQKTEEATMKQIRIGDISIDAVIEREGPWRRPQDFFPAYDDAVFKHHLPAMEPEFFDTASGKMFITYQTFVVRTPRYTILVDTCTGEDKGHPAPFDFPGKERWRNELFALGIAYEQVDYVFCTHLHIDHTGWNTTLRDGRWVPTFPNAKYIFHKKEYAVWEAEYAKGAERPGKVFRDNCLPIVEAGQALLVDDDYALDDTVTLTPTPGHSPCHCCVNIFSKGQRAVVAGDLVHHAIQCREPDWSSGLGPQAVGDFAPDFFCLRRGHRYADPADPFSGTDGRPDHGGRRSVRLPVQTGLAVGAKQEAIICLTRLP